MGIFRRDVFELIVAFALGLVVGYLDNKVQVDIDAVKRAYIKGITDAKSKGIDVEFMTSLK